ncbi:MAG: serine hydrolase [Clostridia bacterium]|nr:serine hydrolase [Clostridia bacterium]
MDIIMYKKAVTFLTKFYGNRKELIEEDMPITKKASPAALPIAHPFPRATPESVGIESAHLFSFLREYAEMTELAPHALMIMRRGQIILETDFYPYRREIWHVSHSMCKSITALAVGLMIDDGVLSLDEKLTDIFKKRAFNLDFAKQNDITVRHLLNMSAGVTFNELGSALYEDWIEGFFSMSVKFTPGTRFMYNSMNTYMLSACIREKTGRDMFDILCERIFYPMGITEIYWEKCPKGITKGGWGLYMKIEDLMKFATLFLSGGVFEGKRLISSEWLSEMTSKQMETPATSNTYGYGFQVWRSVREDSFQFNGMLGQNLVIFPDIDMAIATYSGNAEFFPTCDLMELIGRYFGESFTPSDVALKPARRSYAMLKQLAGSLSMPPARARGEARPGNLASMLPFLGKTYRLNAENVGILPVVMSVFHGNYSEGIKSVAFRAKGNVIEAVFTKERELICIPFSTDGRACYFDFMENREHFYAASIAKMTKNEDDIPVFKLSIYFLETTSVRHIKFFFHRKRIVVRFSEDPTAADMLEAFAPTIEEFLEKNKAIRSVVSKVDMGLVDYNIEKVFTPEFIAEEIKEA